MALYELSLLGLSERSHSLVDYGDLGDILYDNYWGNIDKYLTIEEKNKAIEILEDQIQRGDIVKIIEADHYKDDGRMIYDGKNLIDMHYCGSSAHPPSSFHVGDEFLVDHWKGSINHDYIIWINHAKYREQLLANMNGTHTSFTTHLGTFTIGIITEFDINEGIIKFIAKIKSDEPIQFLSHDFINKQGLAIDPYIMYYCH